HRRLPRLCRRGFRSRGVVGLVWAWRGRLRSACSGSGSPWCGASRGTGPAASRLACCSGHRRRGSCRAGRAYTVTNLTTDVPNQGDVTLGLDTTILDQPFASISGRVTATVPTRLRPGDTFTLADLQATVPQATFGAHFSIVVDGAD